LLQAADALAVPSVGEGFPLIAQEAMACGLPVLLANDPAYERYVDESVAVMVEPSVEGVRDGLQRLLGDAGRRQASGRAARQRMVETSSWDTNVQMHLALYKRLLQERARGSWLAAAGEL